MFSAGFTEIVQLILDAVGNPDSINRMLNTVDAEGDTVSLLCANISMFIILTFSNPNWSILLCLHPSLFIMLPEVNI